VLKAQQLLSKRFVIRPPPLDSKLHKNMAMALSPEKKPGRTIKANPILEDFAHEHMANLERDNEQRKLRCALIVAASTSALNINAHLSC
jgi:hypothetical protein